MVAGRSQRTMAEVEVDVPCAFVIRNLGKADAVPPDSFRRDGVRPAMRGGLGIYR